MPPLQGLVNLGRNHWVLFVEEGQVFTCVFIS